jgi:hypothetical protein
MNTLNSNRAILLAAALIASWLAMQQVHELGHVLGAWVTGGEVARVVLHPLSFSRTDLAVNPRPLVVAWAGPVMGVVIPLLVWMLAAWRRMPGAFVLRFFTGFCLLANGAYLGIGSFDRVGDCGDLLRHGAKMWQLWLFGAITAPAGLWLWHGLGAPFGIGSRAQEVSRGVTVAVCVACVLLLAIAFVGWPGVVVPA